MSILEKLFLEQISLNSETSSCSYVKSRKTQKKKGIFNQMMSIEYMSAINLSTFSELKYPSFQKDVERLEKTLEIVKNTDERLTSCYVRSLFILVEDDMRVIIKELERTAESTSEETLKTSLLESLDSYKKLLARSEELELAFIPYLFCPAMEREC